jgi:polar amino acid transport system substrate-binding protein
MKHLQLIQSSLIITLLYLGLSSNAHSLDSEKLTVFVDSSYPPYMYEVTGTDADGLYPRLLKEVARKAEQEIAIHAYPWKRALLYGASGKGAVGGAYKNDERLKAYDYSAPLYQEKLVLFVHKDKIFEFDTLDDLKGKVVGVNRGWSYGQAFDTARKNELFSVNIRNNPNDNFKVLALGRIDCIILDQLSGDSYIDLLGISEQVTALPNAVSINNGYLIIPKKLKMKSFLSKFNTSLETMQNDGSYQNIVQAFIQGTIPEE